MASTLQINRLLLGPPWQWYEAIGDPVTNLGGAAIPAPRQALRHQVTVATFAGDDQPDTVAARLALRRQLRSLFNNTQLKLQGFFYVIYADDPEQNGWYVPDFGQLADIDAAVGLASGVWKLEQVAWIKQGHKRTNREARNVWMKDLRLGVNWRDTLRFLFSTDFSALPAIPLLTVPNGATQIANAVSGQVTPAVALPVGRDGTSALQIVGAIAGPIGQAQPTNLVNPDLACLSFERPDSAMNQSDVRVLDRRGNIGVGPYYLANVQADMPMAQYRLDQGDALVDLINGRNGSFFGTTPANLLNGVGGMPSFETSVASMQTDGVGSSVVQSGAQAFDGSFSALVTSLTAGGTQDLYCSLPTQIPVQPGLQYEFEFYSRGITSARNILGVIQFRGAGNSLISQVNGSTITDSTTGWTASIVVSGIAPAGATHAWFIAERQGNSANEQWYADAFIAIQGSGLGAYYTNGSWSSGQTGALTGGSDTNASTLFNDNSAYGTVPYNAAFALQTFTYEAWIKPVAYEWGGNTDGMIMAFGDAGSHGVVMGFQGTGLKFWIVDGGGTLRAAGSAANAAPLNLWSYCVLTYDGTTARLYINGVQVTSLAFTGVTYSTTLPFCVGSYGSGNTQVFDGYLDEIAVYPYALTPNQIANHYASGVCYDGGNQWEEAYGPDYPWSWTEGGVNDCPILDNGLVRIRYDSTNVPGFRLDIWDTTGYGVTNGTPGWAEQGKMTLVRIGDSTNFSDLWVSAGIHIDGGWTPDRATISVVFQTSLVSDAYSRERIFITNNRGNFGITFEAYAAVKANGSQADVEWRFQPYPTGGTIDDNDAVLKIDSQGTGNWTPGAAAAAQNTGPTPAKYIATAGSGSALFSSQTVGNASYTTSENWITMLRCDAAITTPHPWTPTFTVIQAAGVRSSVDAEANNYGINNNALYVQSQNGAGYASVDISYAPTQLQQVMEAENMTLSSGTTAIADPSASAGNTTQTSRTTIGSHVTQANWPNSFIGTYRIFARVKVNSTQGSFRAICGGTTGVTVTVAGVATPLYQWVDLGEFTSNNGTLEIDAAATSGGGTVEVDRIESILVQDRARNNAIYTGARDNGFCELYDARTLGAVVAR